MRKILVSTAAILATTMIAAGADAQDFSLFGGPPVNWTGAYTGIEGGYGWGTSRHSDATGFNSGPFDANGGTVGSTLGYNWQFNGPFVFGLESDMAWADMGGKTAGACSGTCGTRLSDLGTIRGRVGYSFGRIMPYATGGLAYGDVHADEGGAPFAQGGGGEYRVGWAAGAGVEDAIAPRWSVKLEYLHVDLGNSPIFVDTFSSGGGAAQNVGFHTDMVRAGINYKFW